MEQDRIPPSDIARTDPEASFAERVRKVQERVAKAGFGAGSTTPPEADKAFMDEMLGED